MNSTKLSLWKRIGAYSAFTLVALMLTFSMTFPYGALQKRAVAEADNAGFLLTMSRLGPGLLAITAKEVEIAKKSSGEAAEGLHIDSMSVGPTFFPPGVSVQMKLMGGTVTTRVSGLSTKRVRVDVSELDLSKGNVKAVSGIDFSGKIDAHVDLTIPVSAGGPQAPREPDVSLATGSIVIDAQTLGVNGGTANISVPQFGPEPTPFDLPRIPLGELSAKLKIDKGVATVEEFKTKSAEVELALTGTIKLAKRFEYAEPNIEVRLKTDPGFQKGLGMLGSALSIVQPDPKDPNWRMGRLTGYLGRPQFR
jgi:type II secretion system protein N